MEDLLCLVCAEGCRFFGVFDCSHGVCGICAIRVHTITKKGCPVCRHQSKELIVTRDAPIQGEYTFDIDSLKRRKNAMLFNRALGVRVDGCDLNNCIDKLHQYCCPMQECWNEGSQQPFRLMDGLREHLQKSHQVDYCSICLENRPVFVSEQHVFTEKEKDLHNKGECSRDPESFVGHPMCFFCNRRFYDGEHLLKHLQQKHFSCDLCNRGEYTFTFYKNRDKLIHHFSDKHKLCEHAGCRDLDPMLRVFQSDVELQSHMQSVHGATAKEISLEALGFRFGGNSAASVSSAVGTSARNGPVQTGANVVATFIKFDHIHRVDRIELEPTHKKPAGRSRGRATSVKAILNNEPLPQHYLSRSEIFSIVQIPIDEELDSPKNQEGKSISVSKKKEDDPPKREGPAEHVARLNRHELDVLKKLPTSNEERQRLLLECACKYLGRGSARYSQFTSAVGDYRSGKMFATEFYKGLKQVFPTEDTMEEVFPLIAGVIEDSSKQQSLFTAKSMLSCLEFQNQEKSRLEMEKKQEEERLLKEIRAQRAGVASKGKHLKNAWNYGSTAPATPPITSPVSKIPHRAQSVWAQASSNSPSSASAAIANAPTLATAFSDPTDFPSLASNPSTKRWPTGNAGAKKPGAKSNNVWFKK